VPPKGIKGNFTYWHQDNGNVQIAWQIIQNCHNKQSQWSRRKYGQTNKEIQENNRWTKW
jgi:hypothetical protein